MIFQGDGAPDLLSPTLDPPMEIGEILEDPPIVTAKGKNYTRIYDLNHLNQSKKSGPLTLSQLKAPSIRSDRLIITVLSDTFKTK